MKLDKESTPNDSFVWPPHTRTDDQEDQLPHDSPSTNAPNSLIESIETHLLGRTGLAFDVWAQRTQWKRDSLTSYCWRCAGSIGAHESDGEGCADCRTKSLPWERAIRLGRYSGKLRDEILALKFQAWRPTGRGLGIHLGLAIREQLESAQISPEQAILVPIPMHRFRRIARGVDHTMVICKAAAESSGCSFGRYLASKSRPEQIGLSKTQRAQNMKGAFHVPRRRRNQKSGSFSNPRVFILIDDVRTTGATFVAGCKALKTGLKALNMPFESTYNPPTIWAACIGVAGETRKDAL